MCTACVLHVCLQMFVVPPILVVCTLAMTDACEILQSEVLKLQILINHVRFSTVWLFWFFIININIHPICLSMNSAMFFVITEGCQSSALRPAEDPTRNSVSFGRDVFLTICTGVLLQSHHLLSRVSIQTATHTFRLQEIDTRNFAWSKSEK